MDRFDDHALELRCTDCGRMITKTIAWLKIRRSMNCSWCGTLIAIDRPRLLEDVEKAEQALANPEKYFGKPSG
jgi:hypothetical protein